MSTALELIRPALPVMDETGLPRDDAPGAGVSGRQDNGVRRARRQGFFVLAGSACVSVGAIVGIVRLFL